MQVKNENGRRGIFLIEAGLAAFMFALGWIVLPRDEGKDSSIRDIDWVGTVVITGGLALLTYDLAYVLRAIHTIMYITHAC